MEAEIYSKALKFLHKFLGFVCVNVNCSQQPHSKTNMLKSLQSTGYYVAVRVPREKKQAGLNFQHRPMGSATGDSKVLHCKHT